MLEFLKTHHLILYPIGAFIGALFSTLSFNLRLSRNIAIFLSLINLIISIIPDHNKASEYSLGGWSYYRGINFHIWDKSSILICLVNFIFSFVLIFGYKSLEGLINNQYKESRKHLIYSLLQLAQSGFLGIIVTQDFFTLYVFIEISSLSSYVLLSISKTRDSLISALNYLILGTIGASFILIGIGIILKTTGHLNMIMAHNNIVMSQGFEIGISIYIVGVLLKLAFFPIYSWMISAYKNVFSTILIYIGSVSSVVASYILYELIYLFLDNHYYSSLFYMKEFLYYLSGIVIIFFAYCAFLEENIKKILLYSSAMYAGYFVMMIVSNVASNILIYYLVSIAIIKMGLFYCLSISERYNLESESIAVPSKIFYIIYLILIISNAGLPISGGFVGKMLLLKDLSRLECYYGIVTILISSSISLFYNYKIVQKIKIMDSIKLDLSDKIGLLLVGLLQFLLIFLPNYIDSSFDNISITNQYSYLLLYGIILISIILFSSFIRSVYLRLSILLSVSTFYMIMLIYIGYNYFKDSEMILCQIFSYKIYDFEFLSFSIDQYSMIYLLLLAILWPISILYTSSYLQSNDNKTHSKFLFFMNLSIVSASFIAISGNLITMFSFYEILSLSTIPLIIYSGTEESYKALYKYLKLLFIPSTFFFLLAIFLIYANFGHSSFIDDTGLFEYIKISEYQVIFILLLFILGIAKLATIPFYSWLSTAMVAIHPVSAILHAVAIVNSGIFCFAKILIYIFGIDYLSEISMGQYLIFIPISTIIFGSIIALYQDSVKKILAYSTIIQMNIMLASLLSFTKIGLIGAITHMVVHSLTKLLLFFKAGDIYIATKANRLEQLRGLSKIMPISYIVMFIASLALAGLPLSPNYFTKKIIASSFSDYTIYVIKISSIFTCIYLTKILYYMSKKQVNNIEIGKIGKMQLLSGYIIFVLIILAAIFISREFVIPFYKLMEEFLIFGLVFLLIILIFRNSHLQFFQKLKSIKILWGYVELIFDKFYSMINKSIINPFNRQIIVAANLSGVNISLYSALILLIIFSLICLCNKFLLV